MSWPDGFCYHTSDTRCQNCAPARGEIVVQTGWMCPRCFRVNAPAMMQCFCQPVVLTGAGATEGDNK